MENLKTPENSDSFFGIYPDLLQTCRPVHGRRDSRLRRDVETARPRCGDPQQLRRQLGRAVVLSLHPRAGSSSVLHAGFTDVFTAITTF